MDNECLPLSNFWVISNFFEVNGKYRLEVTRVTNHWFTLYYEESTLTVEWSLTYETFLRISFVLTLPFFTSMLEGLPYIVFLRIYSSYYLINDLKIFPHNSRSVYIICDQELLRKVRQNEYSNFRIVLFRKECCNIWDIQLVTWRYENMNNVALEL